MDENRTDKHYTLSNHCTIEHNVAYHRSKLEEKIIKRSLRELTITCSDSRTKKLSRFSQKRASRESSRETWFPPLSTFWSWKLLAKSFNVEQTISKLSYRIFSHDFGVYLPSDLFSWIFLPALTRNISLTSVPSYISYSLEFPFYFRLKCGWRLLFIFFINRIS